MGLPDQLPFVVVSCCPTMALPEMAGTAVFTGALLVHPEIALQTLRRPPVCVTELKAGRGSTEPTNVARNAEADWYPVERIRAAAPETSAVTPP